MITKKLSNGFTVLATKRGRELFSRGYVNRTQAQKAADRVGPQAQVWQPGLGPCFYVIVEIAMEAA